MMLANRASLGGLYCLYVMLRAVNAAQRAALFAGMFIATVGVVTMVLKGGNLLTAALVAGVGVALAVVGVLVFRSSVD